MNEPVTNKPADPAKWSTLEDCELLHEHAEHESEAAFAELVRRRIGLVYSIALRQTHGDRHRAQDVTQSVFVDLARKSRALSRRPVIAGWLYRSARFAAAGVMRAEQRRTAREQEAGRMETLLMDDTTNLEWEKLRPMLDEALSELGEDDRDAVLLRFFDARPFADIGAKLRLTENAARMRVERALDKLNGALGKRGVTSTAAALAAAVGQQASAELPASLAASVTGLVFSQAGISGGTTATVMAGLSKLQLGIVGAIIAAGAAGYVAQESELATARAELSVWQQRQAEVAGLRAENRRLAAVASEIDLLRGDDAEFKVLEERIQKARQANGEAARRARTAASPPAVTQNVQAEIDRMNREGNALVMEYKVLAAQGKDPSAAEDVRLRAEADAKLKLTQIQEKQREIQTFIANARAANPDLDLTRRTTARNSESERIVYYPGTAYEYSGTPAGENVSFRLHQVDCPTALSALETISGRPVVRDPSLAGVSGTLDLQPGAHPNQNALQALSSALREQLNVVLEPTPDGRLVAKLGPPR